MKNQIIVSVASLFLTIAGVTNVANASTALPADVWNKKILTTPATEGPFAPVEHTAQFPGGEQAFIQYINQQMVYPKIAKEQGIEGRVIVSIEIDEEGKINTIDVLQGIGGGCEEEIVRLIRNMPNWEPTNQAGHILKAKKIFSFNFQL